MAIDIRHSDPLDSEHIIYSQCDVTSEEDVTRAIHSAAEKFGRIDCLINNAAIATPYMHYDTFDHLDMGEFHRYLSVNLCGPLLLLKVCSPFLRLTRGAVINISSTRARMSEPKCEGEGVNILCEM